MNVRIFLIALCAAGCASSEREPSKAAAPAAPARAAPGGEGASVSGLAESAIPKSGCGMVLWTLDEERPTPIFRYIVGKSAEMVLNGKQVKLALTEATGSGGFGVFESQRFTADGGMTVDVQSRFSLGFDGGAYLERGVISVMTADGWKTVVPAAGLAGCRS